ncbi:MAG: Gfo/Idh/MocA family oxidoreductase [Kiritimatiellae bacterium]|nr:Gfo/Idh/MocA family oxidoreductase [Kiritimatiellia bacterium]
MEFSRREFIGAAAFAGAFAALGGSTGAAPCLGQLVKGRKINIACVGCGGKGWVDINGVAGENIVGLCDVDYNRAKKTFQRFPNAKTFIDWREMLLTLKDQIDAVVVSTPDHMHFPIAMMAMEMGKHVYVQKPIAHTVTEARLMLEQARRHKVMTQMGNQGRCGEGTRLIKEWFDAGALGDVKEVHIWTNRPVWPQNIPVPPAQTAPFEVDWNRWLGVAPWRPYNKSYLPFNWRGWWEWGTGAIGDMGCHMMDAAFWALKLGAPKRVSAQIEGGDELSCPAGSIITYEFPARGALPPVVVKWFDGCCHPPRPAALDAGLPMPRIGQCYFGSKNVLLDTTDCCENPHLIPRSANKAFKRPPKTLARVPGGNPYQNWLDAIRGNIELPSSNFEHAGPLTEMVMLGAIAVRSRTAFNWNADTLTCDNPAAQRYVDKTYRMF